MPKKLILPIHQNGKDASCFYCRRSLYAGKGLECTHFSRPAKTDEAAGCVMFWDNRTHKPGGSQMEIKHRG